MGEQQWRAALFQKYAAGATRATRWLHTQPIAGVSAKLGT